ncbi:MAG: phosphoribosylanthranilate isomerase [Planctomycetota bacterium]|jgi:phosphoribosylanthranilate isomerase
MTRVKICGITSVELAGIAVEAGADAIGLVIGVPDSPRSIRLETAEAILESVPPHVLSIAVVQDPEPDLADRWTGSWFQLHGDEDEELVGRFGRTKHVIRGFRFEPQQVQRWNACPHVELLLVDGSSGGRGEAFHHEQLLALMPEISKPVILAGGLTPQNVGTAVRGIRPFAVDVSSGVESAPGVKDPDLIREFCQAVAEVDKS